MKMNPVNSSNINAIGYDATQETLHVEFSSGKTYSYSNVKQSVYDAFKDAESVGSYFAKHIRNKHSAEQV